MGHFQKTEEPFGSPISLTGWEVWDGWVVPQVWWDLKFWGANGPGPRSNGPAQAMIIGYVHGLNHLASSKEHNRKESISGF